MLIYTINKRFFSSPLGIYIPVGAIIYRYENSTKLGLEGVPQEDPNTGITTDKFEYDTPELVTWFYLVENDPDFATHTGTEPESPSGGSEVAVDSVNTQTGAVVLDADDISDAATTNKYTTAGDISKLAAIEAGADVTDAANVKVAIPASGGYLALQTLTDATTIAYDAANGVQAKVTITADRTLGAISNATAGMSGTLTIIQDGVGGWALTLNANQIDMLGTLGDITALIASKVAKIAWETHDGTNFYLYITAQP